MIPLFGNATVLWTEREIEERDALIRLIATIVRDAWQALNPAVTMIRVETPILTPAEHLGGHIAAGFELLGTDRGYLRPETTAGTFAALGALFPQQAQRMKRLPVCLWQAGKSFRDEAHGETMRATKLRLREFWQQEFQLFCRPDTKADYLGAALAALTARFGGEAAPADELPHYSRRTVDWHMRGLEVAGCSERTDWPDGVVFEVAIGLDRLVALKSA